VFLNSLYRFAFAGKEKQLKSGEKQILYRFEIIRPYNLASPSFIFALIPRERIRNKTSSANCFLIVENSQRPFVSIVPSLSISPVSNTLLVFQLEKRYFSGICLFPKTPIFRNSAFTI